MYLASAATDSTSLKINAQHLKVVMYMQRSNRVCTIYILDHIYQPLRLGRIWHKVIVKRSLTGLNIDFSFY